ncbi:MAG TPA: aconitase X catalytic domain-containing protein [Vicinamibacterales bacterium]|nr:aconitase X catalytic domain-containing protein [Vicinamibacterales bacterium]
MRLTAQEQAMLDGAQGPAPQLAMSILVRMAEVYGASELMPISQAHIDSTIYLGDATLEFAERLASLGAKVAVPTSLNVSGVDVCGWQKWAVPPEWADKAGRQMKAYEQMGAVPTWTCAPYQTRMRPVFGQQIAWGESNAISFANSVIGARTERYPDLLDICCAITGRVPAVGLHLTENRAGQLLVSLAGVPRALQEDDEFFAVLGHLIGKLAEESIPVIDGLVVRPPEDQLKAFAAAAASSGRVALFHMVGITPEAPTLEAAFQNRAPLETVDVTVEALRAARAELSNAEGTELDMVLLGSPHFSIDEFRRLVPLVEGRKRHPRVKLLVTTGRSQREQAEREGVLAPILDFGADITLDTCPLASPMLPPEIRTLMTNSAKYAYYAPSLLDTRVAFGSLADCVRSAIEGRIVRDDSAWRS